MDCDNSRVVFAGEADLRVIVGGIGQATCRSLKRTTSQNNDGVVPCTAHQPTCGAY